MTSPDTGSALDPDTFINQLTPSNLNNLHLRDDVDRDDAAHHHTLGRSSSQAAPGNHTGHMSGTTVPTVTGSRGGNVALASLLTQLASRNIIIDGTVA